MSNHIKGFRPRRGVQHSIQGGMKRCPACDTFKALADFGMKGGEFYETYCKPCKALKARESRARMAGKPLPPDFVERFFDKVNKAGPNGCWLWTGRIEKDGYGRFWAKGRIRMAHAAGLEHVFGRPAPEGMVADHICRNRGCVNPDHLRYVTPRVNTTQNSDSPFAKNRAKTECDSGHPFSRENTAIIRYQGKNFRGKRRPTVTRVCLTCYPHCWAYAVVERPRPPGARIKAWKGPAAPFEHFLATSSGPAK